MRYQTRALKLLAALGIAAVGLWWLTSRPIPQPPPPRQLTAEELQLQQAMSIAAQIDMQCALRCTHTYGDSPASELCFKRYCRAVQNLTNQFVDQQTDRILSKRRMEP